jgi:hypothetical protein
LIRNIQYSAFIFFVFLTTSILANDGGQTKLTSIEPYFKAFVSIDAENQFNDNHNVFKKLVSKSRSLQVSDTIQWIGKIYSYIQRKQLKRYEKYVSFNKTLEQGKYDCLTGTALYSLILSELGIKHQILEFEFHVLIYGKIGDHSFLLESTDPYEGFVTDVELISIRLNQNINQRGESNVSLQKFTNPIGISLQELIGLHLFNMAVVQYGRGFIEKAHEYATQAEKYYPSVRIENLKQLLSFN